MKADLFILYSLGVIAGLFAYAFIGGLVVRLWNACPFVETLESDDEKMGGSILWPILVVAIGILSVRELLILAYRLSQWRPRRKSTLPGARVVRK